ncbi:Predicted small integral membrane protein [Legionella lansingensis]|uniref:Low affinity iron permease n=1 Tax=Legionella lansingensis TaxID=45067 RepID=A0A0W0VRR0_9GAMM|nr:low affinity iron permease family protein [Legionella lansingensis]KTD22860.1 Low affinity iron permease [Legionella lansingensis]SNV53662.1 Predicted small integral membrane protein [Legionella lansingensis]
MDKFFHFFAKKVSRIAGHGGTFSLACFIIIIWLISGPFFNFSHTWQLIVNTGTTIITFLIVFLIQNTQNRDSESTQIKLDEIIKSLKKGDNSIIDLENLSDNELQQLEEKYKELAHKKSKKEKKDE